MSQKPKTIEEYIAQVPLVYQPALVQLHKTLLQHLPQGFVATLSYDMIGYVVPHSLYPKGYNCNPSLPLPFINVAAQKNYIALYHIGLYMDEQLLAWFTQAYAQQVPTKLDMGKSCIRFKKPEQIPYPLITELAKKLTPQAWIALYESCLKK